MKRMHAIVLDKLVFSCISTKENNFNCLVENDEDYSLKKELYFNKTILLKSKDPSNRFRNSYNVFYGRHRMATIDFSIYGKGFYAEGLRFTVFNEVFYNSTFKYLSEVLNDLNLRINNFSKLDIAIDFHNFNIEKFLRKAIRKKENEIKVFGRCRNREKRVREILYENQGSPNDPDEVQTTYIRNKKDTLKACVYNKMDEIELSGKEYILDYHKSLHPYVIKSLFRFEIRMEYEELYKYQEKHPNAISLENLQKASFLYSLFEGSLSRIIEIYKGKGKKREKIQLIPAFSQIVNNNQQ